jgi:hypothetical protein
VAWQRPQRARRGLRRELPSSMRTSRARANPHGESAPRQPGQRSRPVDRSASSASASTVVANTASSSSGTPATKAGVNSCWKDHQSAPRRVRREPRRRARASATRAPAWHRERRNLRASRRALRVATFGRIGRMVASGSTSPASVSLHALAITRERVAQHPQVVHFWTGLDRAHVWPAPQASRRPPIAPRGYRSRGCSFSAHLMM